jgi:hypothetical protein
LFAAGLAALAVPVSIAGFREIWRQREYFDSGFWLVLGSAVVINVAAPVAKLSGNFTRWRSDLGGESIEYTGLASVLASTSHGALFFLASCFVLFLLAKQGAAARIRPGTVPIILMLLLSMLASGAHSYGTFNAKVFVLAVLVVAAGLAQGGRGAQLAVTAVGLSVAALSAIVAIVAPGSAIAGCVRKCGAFSSVFSGVLLNENQLGMLIVCCIPFAATALVGKIRWWTIGLFASVILASGSRSSMLTLAVVLIVLLIVRPTAPHPEGRYVHAAAAVSAVGLVCILVPMVNKDPTSFTNRGYLWQVAIERFWSSPVVGRGWADWSHAFIVFRGAEYGPHNQWLHILNIGGLAGAVLFVVFTTRLLGGGGRKHAALVGTVLVAAIASGITENPLSFGAIEWMSWMFPAMLLAAPMSSSAADRYPAGSLEVAS